MVDFWNMQNRDTKLLEGYLSLRQVGGQYVKEWEYVMLKV